MNAQRRKALKAIIEQLETLDTMLETIREQLADVQDEEQAALENMPESLQESERGQQMDDYISAMQDVAGELDLIDVSGLIDQLQEIVDG